MNQTKKHHDVYQEVTDTVIEALQKGEVIWHKGWNSLGLPKNIVSEKAYRGWNVFWLNFVTRVKGYRTPYFLTFKQAQDLGGSIKKGQKGIRITYWATIQDKSTLIHVEDPATGETSSKHLKNRISTVSFRENMLI